MPSAKQFPPSVQGNIVTSFMDIRPGDLLSDPTFRHERAFVRWPSFVKGESSLQNRVRELNLQQQTQLRTSTGDNFSDTMFYDSYGPTNLPEGVHSDRLLLARNEGKPWGVGVWTPKPPGLKADVKGDYQKSSNVKKRHRQTKEHREPGMPEPKTRNGQVIHALNRIVPGGDPETNQFFQNSVAVLLSQGALRDTETTKPSVATQTDSHTFRFRESVDNVTSAFGNFSMGGKAARRRVTNKAARRRQKRTPPPVKA